MVVAVYAMATGSLIKGLTILTKLAEFHRDWGLTELAKVLRCEKSTVYRILATMVSMGFVEKDQQTKRYRIGPRVGALFPSPYERIKEAADPILRELSQSLGLTVALRVREGNQMVVIDRVESRDLLRVTFPIGWRHPITFGASGKVVLAFLPRDEAQQLVEGTGAVNGQQRPRKWRDRFWDELKDITTKGYGISQGLTAKGAITIAVPIFLETGRPGGVLSMSWPEVKYPQNALTGIIEKGITAANKISNDLGSGSTSQHVRVSRT